MQKIITTLFIVLTSASFCHALMISNASQQDLEVQVREGYKVIFDGTLRGHFAQINVVTIESECTVSIRANSLALVGPEILAGQGISGKEVTHIYYPWNSQLLLLVPAESNLYFAADTNHSGLQIAVSR